MLTAPVSHTQALPPIPARSDAADASVSKWYRHLKETPSGFITTTNQQHIDAARKFAAIHRVGMVEAHADQYAAGVIVVELDGELIFVDAFDFAVQIKRELISRGYRAAWLMMCRGQDVAQILHGLDPDDRDFPVMVAEGDSVAMFTPVGLRTKRVRYDDGTVDVSLSGDGEEQPWWNVLSRNDNGRFEDWRDALKHLQSRIPDSDPITPDLLTKIEEATISDQIIAWLHGRDAIGASLVTSGVVADHSS